MLYKFASTTPVEEVNIPRTGTGAKRAYLKASAEVSPQTLTEIRTKLSARGIIATPITIAGDAMLEVRKFNSSEQLLSILHDIGAVEGTPSKQGHSESPSLWEIIKHNTFNISLGFYLIGDIGYILYGKWKNPFGQKKAAFENRERAQMGYKPFPEHPANPYDEYAGYAYSMGTASAVLSTLARGDQSDEEVQAITRDVDAHLKQSGFTLEGAGDTTRTERSGLVYKLKEVFKKYPSEMLNFCFAAAGALMMISSRGHLKVAKTRMLDIEHNLASPATKRNAKLVEELSADLVSAKQSVSVAKQDIVLGGITVASGLLANFIREKPKQEGEPEPSNIFAKAWRWLEEKPLRIAGGGLFISTAIHVGSTIKDYIRIGKDKGVALSRISSGNAAWKELGKEKLALANQERGLTHGRMVFCVTNIIAEVMLMLSSKGHGDGVLSDATVASSATAITAEKIAKLATDMQERAIEESAAYLASPKVMGGGNKEQIARNLRTHLREHSSNRWASNFKPAVPDAPRSTITAAQAETQTLAPLQPSLAGAV